MTYEEIKLIDYNKISEFLYLGYILKTLRMFMVIVALSYFSAMIFKIIIEIEEDFYGHIVMTACDDAGGYFKACYDLWDQSSYEVILKLVYFIFTTLSTVGFGDFNPKSNIERLVLAFGMLLGVAIFSLIMGQFIEMVESVKDLQAEYEDGERLAIFFGVLTTFNRGEIIKVELKREIEKFFDYKWIKEKNHALQHDDYQNIVMQLPEEIVDEIYTIFLYAPFVKVYSVIFEY